MLSTQSPWLKRHVEKAAALESFQRAVSHFTGLVECCCIAVKVLVAFDREGDSSLQQFSRVFAALPVQELAMVPISFESSDFENDCRDRKRASRANGSLRKCPRNPPECGKRGEPGHALQSLEIFWRSLS